MEEVRVLKTARVHRNADDTIIIDEEGYITCQTDSGLAFKIHSSEVDLNGPPITCTFDNEDILILLTPTSRTIDTSSEIIDISNQENQQPNIARHNFEIFSWNDSNTKLFLSLYKEMRELVGSRRIKNFKEMWKRISDEMNNSGYDVTAIQVENKWKTLERQYKKVISNNNKTGRGRITCSYQTELTEILGKCHKIVPLAVTGPEVGVMVRNNVSDPRTLLNNSAPILMPVSATTVLPTTSNVERRQEFEDVPVASLVESDAIPEPIPDNANNLIAVAKRRVATGTTAKALQQCQEEMKEYRKTLEKRQEKQDNTLTQILETYKAIQDRHEKYLTEMENYRKQCIQQRQRRNDLMEEKNNLLKQFLNSLKRNTE